MPSDSRFQLAGYRWLWPPLARSLTLAVAPAGLLALIGILLRQRPTVHWDQSFSIWLQGRADYSLTVLGFVTDWLCSWQVLFALAAIACLALAARQRWLAALSAALLFPLVGVEVALKYFVHQPPASLYLQVRVLEPTSHISAVSLPNGFPSGHAARIGFALGWIAVFATPARYRGWALAVAAVLALFIGWTRIYVGDHSALEIAGGLLLSAAFLLPAEALLTLARRRPGR